MSEPNRSDEAVEIRRRAVRRLLVAVGLLAAAFGGLLLFERYTASRVAQAPPRAAPEAVAPALPAEPAPAAPAAPAQGEPDRAPAIAAEPERSEAPAREPPAPPRVVNNERLFAPPPRPVEAPRAREPAPAAAVREAPKALPPARADAPARTEGRAELPRGYQVQLGVFASPDNAQALQRKLAELGVATSTETRVLLGPFNERAEAERALEQMRRLGVGAILAPAR
jgi:DedD protein